MPGPQSQTRVNGQLRQTQDVRVDAADRHDDIKLSNNNWENFLTTAISLFGKSPDCRNILSRMQQMKNGSKFGA